MGQFKDLTNQSFGRLTALWSVGKNRHGGYLWSCQCACGNVKTALSGNLIRGTVKSCGCLQRERVANNVAAQSFGRLTALTPTSGRRNGCVAWLCKCACGNFKTVRLGNLTNGKIQSCGCLARDLSSQRWKTHGQTGSPSYASWQAMKDRCFNPNSKDYARYGAKGITVCTRWLESFENFFEDMGERPENTTLDRFPNKDGNYEPSNCRWATPAEQGQNRSVTKLTPEKVRAIRARVVSGEAQTDIADIYDICH